MKNMADQADEDPRDPATIAFDALRNELINVRQSVESLDKSIQESRPYDYRKSLGQILRTQEGIQTEIEGIRLHPAISLTPEGFAHQLEKAKSELIKEDKRDLKFLLDALTHNCIVMKGYMDNANDATYQKLIIGGTAFIFFCAGTIFSVTTMSAISNRLPNSWQAPERIASNILGDTMRNSGIRLIKANNPSEWDQINFGKDFMHKYYDTIDKCNKELVSSKKEIKCMILIK